MRFIITQSAKGATVTRTSVGTKEDAVPILIQALIDIGIGHQRAVSYVNSQLSGPLQPGFTMHSADMTESVSFAFQH